MVDNVDSSLLQDYFDSSSDAIIGYSKDGVIVSWNTGAEQLYGYTADEALGRKIAILHEEEQQRDVLSRVSQDPTSRSVQITRLTKSGKRLWVSISIVPINGENIACYSVERDISHLKSSHKRLVQQKTAAEQANRVKSEFLANVSHELRTPMNAILGMTNLALEEDLNPALRDYLETAKESADALLRLLDDVLDLSKLEAGRLELEDAPFDLRDTIDSTMKAISQRGYQKGLELAADMSHDLPVQLVGDSVRLRQILTNLLSNAIKFTEQGEITLTVQSRGMENEHITLEFAVSDTGSGISREDQEKIFDPFMQADSSFTRQFGGTGLGLSIAKQLVDHLDGKMWLESGLGIGSTFFFTARFRVGSTSSFLRAFATPPVVAKLRGLRVLVVDDNETNRRILFDTLSGWQMRPSKAASAMDALAILQNGRTERDSFRLIIIDALMPSIDGLGLIENAREQQLLEGATILMVSSADRLTFRERFSSLPVKAYLEKPVSQSDLLDAIVTALGVATLDGLDEENIDTGQTEPLQILVAEDTLANRKVVEAVLKKRGHQVTLAHNGREAVELAREREFDVVLMDVQMPIMDGLQATAAIRDIEKDSSRRTPIIALTAHAMRGDRQKCLAAGMDDYVSKPIDVPQFLKTLKRVSVRAAPSPRSRIRNPSRQQEFVEMDLDAALARLDGDEALLHEMMEAILEDMPTLVRQLGDSLAREDRGLAGRSAHSLKSLAASLAAKRVSDQAALIENLATEDRLSDISAKLPEFEEAVESLQSEIRCYL